MLHHRSWDISSSFTLTNKYLVTAQLHKNSQLNVPLHLELCDFKLHRPTWFLIGYFHLSNKRGAWNKRGGVPKMENHQININYDREKNCHQVLQ